MTPGLIIAAPASGAGKTTVTLGLLAALRAQGVVVQPFKNGPDYIDPAFHAAASGRESINLDTWAMSQARIAGLVGGFTEGADLVIAEGSMGFHDGVARPGAAGNGSGADLALLTGWPVVLVLDVSGQAQSAAAVALGMGALRPGVRLAGVIANRVASPRHEALIRAGLEGTGIPLLGALPRQGAVALPERYLGLVQAEETGDLDNRIAALAAFVSASVDMAALRAVAGGGIDAAPAVALAPPAERIALARDAAFSFVYPHVLAGWRAGGATILPFSPLADEGPDPSADLCWLPGGYPELHAPRLAAAHTFRGALRRFAVTRPVHGECGGYMALGAGLVAADGTRHEMAGLLGLETSFAKRRMHLGYRLARLDSGERLRGHEFHYATILAQPDAPLAEVRDANGETVAETGSRRGNVSGTFFHLIAPED